MPIVIQASIDGANIGPTFSFVPGQLSKTGLIKWAFGIASLAKVKGSVVVKTFTTVLPALQAGASRNPQYIAKFPTLFTVGKIPTMKGSGNASVLSPQSVSVPYGVAVTYGANGDSSQIAFDQGSTIVSWDNRRDGVTMPKWRSVITGGGNATTPMSASRAVLSRSAGWMEVDCVITPASTWSTKGVYGYLTAATPNLHPVGSLATIVSNRALAKLHDKLYALEHDADIGETLAEYRQSLSMIGKPLQGLRDLVDLYRKRAAEVVANRQRRWGRPLSSFDKRHVADLNRALASLYLEFTFGWKPLANDVLAVIGAIEKSRSRVKEKISVSYRDDALVSDRTILDGAFNSYCYFNLRELKTIRVSVRYQVGIVPSKVAALSFAERVGLVPSRFVPTAYAALPYSWLLDYFTGINTVLDGLCDSFEFTSWKCKTTRIESITEITVTPDPERAASALTTAFKAARGVPAVSRAVRTDVTRVVPVDFIPSVELSLPKSWRPWANVAALGFQKKLRQLSSLPAALLPLL